MSTREPQKNLDRRSFLTQMAGGLAGLSLPMAWPSMASGQNNAPADATAKNRAPSPAERPNILLIMADDLGWGDLGCYGGRRITPNLDQLAADGTMFTSYYCPSPLCSPSRAGLLTGQHPARHGIHWVVQPNKNNNAARETANFLDPKNPMLPRALKQAGYTTGHFGKWHLGNRGGGGFPVQDYGYDHAATYLSPNADLAKRYDNFREDSTPIIFDEVLQWIDANRSRPFFANVWLREPHTPHFVDRQNAATNADDDAEAGEALTPHSPPYLHVLARIDEHVGKALARLDAMGLRDSTMVIFTSDNGPDPNEGSPGPFRGVKKSLYEGGIRVPFIVRWPGRMPAGKVDSQTVLSGLDLLPTFCALTGAALPEGTLDGEDLAQAFHGQAASRREPLFWEGRFVPLGRPIDTSPRLAMREGPWKLLMNPDRSRIELYDLRQDPHELNNLAAEQPERVQHMGDRLLRWHGELPDSLVHPDAGQMIYRGPAL